MDNHWKKKKEKMDEIGLNGKKLWQSWQRCAALSKWTKNKCMDKWTKWIIYWQMDNLWKNGQFIDKWTIYEQMDNL